ncbi:hypothetical protein [Thermodesulfitimonas sp.]
MRRHIGGGEFELRVRILAGRQVSLGRKLRGRYFTAIGAIVSVHRNPSSSFLFGN